MKNERLNTQSNSNHENTIHFAKSNSLLVAIHDHPNPRTIVHDRQRTGGGTGQGDRIDDEGSRQCSGQGSDDANGGICAGWR